MTHVRKSPEADVDLTEIAFYIAQDDIVAADSLIDTFTEEFELLARHPEMGRLREDLVALIRSFATGNYVILYQPIKDGIEVIRVLHAARDVPALF